MYFKALGKTAPKNSNRTPGARKYGYRALPRIKNRRPSATNTAPTNNPKLRNSRVPVLSSFISSRIISVQFKFLQPIDVLIERLLFGLFDEEIAQQQIIHIGAHEAQVSLFRRADNWFAAHVEGGIDDYRAAVLIGKFFD